jgi:hypothetical protein
MLLDAQLRVAVADVFAREARRRGRSAGSAVVLEQLARDVGDGCGRLSVVDALAASADDVEVLFLLADSSTAGWLRQRRWLRGWKDARRLQGRVLSKFTRRTRGWCRDAEVRVGSAAQRCRPGVGPVRQRLVDVADDGPFPLLRDMALGRAPSQLSDAQRLVLRVAFDVYDGSGGSVSFLEVMEGLAGQLDLLGAVTHLLLAMADGDGVSAMLKSHGIEVDETTDPERAALLSRGTLQ